MRNIPMLRASFYILLLSNLILASLNYFLRFPDGVVTPIVAVETITPCLLGIWFCLQIPLPLIERIDLE